jgi:tRNA1Val (adenine37-N6)-methyltransferase
VPAPTTEGSLLDGRVRYAQPRDGFRSGIEPVLLAATIPARTGTRVLEAGSGDGAALLCLAARVPGVHGLGVEIDAALTDIAAANARANGFADIRFTTADICGPDDWGLFDHACANPPYHRAGGTPSPLPARAGAKIATAGLWADWTAGMARRLRRGGTLTLILPAAALADALAAMPGAQCGSATIFPLWPRTGQPAKLLLLRMIRNGRGPTRLLAGLALHEGEGFGTGADAVLRHAQPLDIT